MRGWVRRVWFPFPGCPGRLFPAWRRGARVWLLPAAVLALAGCAATGVSGPERRALYDSKVAEVFSVAYTSIADRYIDPVGIDALALHALEGMKTIDADIAVVRDGGSVQLRVADVVGAQYATPPSDDIRRWADLTVQMIEAGRAVSPALRLASAEDVYAVAFDRALGYLDPFSRYVGADAAEAGRALRSGFGGIGVRLQKHPEGVEVLEVYEDTPASDAGLKAGDIVVRVDDRALADAARDDILPILRGPVGSAVVVTVKRPGQALAALTMHRALIVPETVGLTLHDGIARITVSSFNRRTAKSMSAALDQARQRAGNALRGIVLDLRNNPGGLMDQAVVVADLFLDRGEIVSTRGRHPLASQNYNADRRDAADGVPLVVLINNGSASAAEIVAAALQDQDRAVVVGSKSYGKGTVQNVIRLPNEGEIILTWSRIYTPAGTLLNGFGVRPSVCTGGGEWRLDDVLSALDRETPAAPVRTPGALEATGGATAEAADPCPASSVALPLDLDVAEALIRSPRLLEKARARARSAELARK